MIVNVSEPPSLEPVHVTVVSALNERVAAGLISVSPPVKSKTILADGEAFGTMQKNTTSAPAFTSTVSPLFIAVPSTVTKNILSDQSSIRRIDGDC